VCVFVDVFSSPYGWHTDLFPLEILNAQQTDRLNFVVIFNNFLKNKASTSLHHRGGDPSRVCFLISGLLNQLGKLQRYYPSIGCHSSWGYSQGPQKTYHC
jgi:hypothetical protein